jgi:uncharacterized membrane protein YeaQ/YmgE (transglycosylase-associated protein family)
MSTNRIANLRRTRFDGGGYLFKQAAIATFVFGSYLHTARLQIGDDTIATERIITPGVDQVFAVLMAYAAIAGWLTRRWIHHPTKTHKVIFTVILGYITATLPLHIATYFTHSTELFMVFPLWYSAVFLAMSTAMIIFVWRLTIPGPVTQTPPAGRSARPTVGARQRT